MVALPGQKIEEVKTSVKEVLKTGARPHLSEYSPVPHSPMFDKAKKHSKYDLDDPIFHNPTLFPCSSESLSVNDIQKIKEWIRSEMERKRANNQG